MTHRREIRNRMALREFLKRKTEGHLTDRFCNKYVK